MAPDAKNKMAIQDGGRHQKQNGGSNLCIHPVSNLAPYRRTPCILI